MIESAHILNECSLLSMEDILHIFPEFVVIDTFQVEIVDCLERHKKSMEASTRELSMFRTRSNNFKGMSSEGDTSIPAGMQCEISGSPVLNAPFFSFPSGHVYLIDCLRKTRSTQLADSACCEPLRIEAIDSPLNGPRVFDW